MTRDSYTIEVYVAVHSVTRKACLQLESVIRLQQRKRTYLHVEIKSITAREMAVSATKWGCRKSAMLTAYGNNKISGYSSEG